MDRAIVKKFMKWQKCIANLRNGESISANYRWFVRNHRTDMHYAYLLTVCNEFSNLGYLKLERQGREKIVHFTDKGKRIKRMLNMLISEIEGK